MNSNVHGITDGCVLVLVVGEKGWVYGGEGFRQYPSIQPEKGRLSIIDSALGDSS
jgi:hypothetical protein